jgi:hypothetical protein
MLFPNTNPHVGEKRACVVEALTEEVLATEPIQCFAMVEGKSNKILVVHGLRKYFNGAVAPEFKGKGIER